MEVRGLLSTRSLMKQGSGFYVTVKLQVSTDTNLESHGKKEPQVRNFLHQTGLWHFWGGGAFS